MKSEIILSGSNEPQVRSLITSVFELKDGLKNDEIELSEEIKKSFRTDGIGLPEITLMVTVVGLIAQPIWDRFIDKLMSKKKETKNINIQINVNSQIYNFPEDNPKILEHFKKNHKKVTEK